jgi:competence protein ComEA
MLDQRSRQSAGGDAARERLAALVRELAPDARPKNPVPEQESNQRRSTGPPGAARSSAGRLVERWVPGGTGGLARVRSFADRHRALTMFLVALVAVIGTVIALSGNTSVAESAPPLPAALASVPVSGRAFGAVDTAMPAGHPTPTEATSLVISVMGKVPSPGLVTVSNGARVADVVAAAGGPQPGTDFGPLNLARRVSDGEQIYVGIPIPPGAGADPPVEPSAAAVTPDTAPGKGGRSRKSLVGAGKVNLNTATADQLQSLPGVGPATAQRIVSWRGTHGRFDSAGQLRDVGGIGPAKFAKLQSLVTT